MTVTKGKKRVLVIDDDESVRSLFVKALEPKGFDVVTSADPEVGVEGARETEPDLIFISLLFPHSNGLKVSKAIHADESLQKVPIVMLITYRGELDPKYTSTIGVVDVLVKPLGAKDVLEKTVSLLGGDAALPEIEEPASMVSAGEKEDVYSLEEEFEDLERQGAGFQDESPWDKEFTDLASEEVFPGTAQEPIAPFSAAEPEGAEIPRRVETRAQEPGGGQTDDFLEYEKEAETAGKEQTGSPGQADAEEQIRRRLQEDDFIEEEQTFPEPKKKFFKKILTAVGVIVIVAGVTIGVLRLMSFYSGESGSRMKKETVKDNLPEAVKPEEEASAPEAGRGAATEGPVPAPAATGVQKTEVGRVQTAAPARKEAKAPVGEKRTPRTRQLRTSATYSVQVGYFKEERHAARLLERLKKNGYDAYLSGGVGEGKRVLIGKFRSRKQAQEQSRRILKDEGLKSVVYQY